MRLQAGVRLLPRDVRLGYGCGVLLLIVSGGSSGGADVRLAGRRPWLLRHAVGCARRRAAVGSARHHGTHWPRRGARHSVAAGAPLRRHRRGSPRRCTGVEGRPVFGMPASGSETGCDVPALWRSAAGSVCCDVARLTALGRPRRRGARLTSWRLETRPSSTAVAVELQEVAVRPSRLGPTRHVHAPVKVRPMG
jgi:hypothetical protein